LEMPRSSEMMKSSRDILKLVDQLVKANNLEKALQEVKKAREVDPKNLYAFAYEERIKELILQRERQEPRGSKSISDSVAVERGFKPYDVREHILNEHTDRFGSKVPALYEEFKKAGLRSSEERENRAKKGATREALDTYRQALLLIWSDGQKTEDEIRELQDLRQSLLITEEEHEVMERQAKLECYILLLRHVLQSPASRTEIESSLEEIRRSFDVSGSDHSVIEANLASLGQSKGQRHVVAVIDDDDQMLSLMQEMLTLSDYEVKSFHTSDAAYEFLSRDRIDLVLCDINLETSSMNGFLFYERVRELPHLQQVPFVFITGLDDPVLMRAGKEMGADDFLVKPIQRENLMATVRGRIKRYEQMRLLLGL
jgi:CheY-like chemotaxis protein